MRRFTEWKLVILNKLFYMFSHCVHRRICLCLQIQFMYTLCTMLDPDIISYAQFEGNREMLVESTWVKGVYDCRDDILLCVRVCERMCVCVCIFMRALV